MKRYLIVSLVLVLIVVVPTVVLAHPMTVMGTVAKIESTRIQVKTGSEKPGDEPAWYPLDDKTVFKRGDKVVSLADAKIKVAEKVVLMIDHSAEGQMKTTEVRLPAR